jgi:hypothetical protein
MSATLIGFGLSVLVVFLGSAVLFARERAASSFLQLIGAGGLVVAVLTRVAEAFDLLPGMGWGLPHSAGHYIDLVSSLSGATLFLVGCVSRGATKHRGSNRDTAAWRRRGLR